MSGPRKIVDQRDALVRAIERNEAWLEDMQRDAIDRGVCPCCVGASYGGTDGVYDRLTRKIERQEQRLKQLNQKIGETHAP